MPAPAAPPPSTPAPAAPAPAPAPSAPAKAPAAPAAPPQASTPERPTESFFDEIDRMDSGQSKPAEKPKAPSGKQAKPDSPQKPPVVGSAEKTSPEDSGTTEPQGKEGETSVPAASKPEPKTAPELRAAYEANKKRLAELEKEVTTLKSKPKEDPDRQALVEALKDREEKLAKLSEELKFASFETTEEYQQQYMKPFNEAFAEGRKRAASRVVNNADGTPRQGTPEDFDAIMRIADDAEAEERAAEMFGSNAFSILSAREKVIEANNRRVNAINEQKSKFWERDKQRAENMAKQRVEMEQRRKVMAESFKKLNEETVNKYPQIFKADDSDAEGKAALEKGFAIADRGFSPPDKTKPEDMVRIHSAIRNKAGAFDYVYLKLTRTAAKLAEVEAKLAEFEKSVPSGGVDRRGTAASGQMSAEDELDALDRG